MATFPPFYKTKKIILVMKQDIKLERALNK